MPQLEPEQYAEFSLMLSELEPVVGSVYASGQSFVRDQIERNKQYGERTLVSVKQMDWLRKIHEEFVGSSEQQEPKGIDGQRGDVPGDNTAGGSLDDDIPF
jgi:hypothetical protein